MGKYRYGFKLWGVNILLPVLIVLFNLTQINNLLKIYFHVCEKYKAQRHSNSRQQQGIITDEALITIYLFCVAYE